MQRQSLKIFEGTDHDAEKRVCCKSSKNGDLKMDAKRFRTAKYIEGFKELQFNILLKNRSQNPQRSSKTHKELEDHK